MLSQVCCHYYLLDYMPRIGRPSPSYIVASGGLKPLNGQGLQPLRWCPALHNVFFSESIFTALHVMQTRSSDENSVCPSVCLSVCLSVTRVYCDKTEERSIQIFISYERTFILVFWEEEWLVGGDPFYLKFWVNRPHWSEIADFQPIIARSASAVTQ